MPRFELDSQNYVVAIKFIRREAFPPESWQQILARFEREARVLAKLNHLNIISITDYGEYEDSPYLVMRYLPGGSLKDRLGRTYTAEEAARMLLPVANALSYAHSHGVQHRDVKTGNILLTDNGAPVLGDFGITHLVDDGEGRTLTGAGVGIGTAEYMSPEQELGKAIDARADVYSLGIVFFELVTGQKPFTAPTLMEVVVKHVHAPLSDPRKINPQLKEKFLIFVRVFRVGTPVAQVRGHSSPSWLVFPPPSARRTVQFPVQLALMTRILLTLTIALVLLAACVDTPPATRPPTNTAPDLLETPTATAGPAAATQTSAPPTPVTFPACISPNAPVTTAKVVKVTDGDTIHVLIDGQEYTVRYISLDAPEATTEIEPYGPEATEFNRALVEGKRVTLVKDVSETDRFGRLLRYVFVGANFVNFELVSRGYANARSYPPDVACLDFLRSAEDEARRAGRGLWAGQDASAPCDCSGSDLDCSDFDSRAAAQACFETCRSQNLGDVFRLDGEDQDGRVCETMP